MNPGAFWRAAYLVAYRRHADDDRQRITSGKPAVCATVELSANSADLALDAYRSRFTVAGQLIDAEADQ